MQLNIIVGLDFVSVFFVSPKIYKIKTNKKKKTTFKLVVILVKMLVTFKNINAYQVRHTNQLGPIYRM